MTRPKLAEEWHRSKSRDRDLNRFVSRDRPGG
jgi:hypothetical protein